MNAGGQPDPVNDRKRPGIAAACGVLALVMGIALPVFIWWGNSQHGTEGVVAAIVAVAVCWLCASAALVISGLFVGTPFALQSNLASIGLRTVLPIVIAIFLDRQVPVLSQAGVFGMMVPAYLLSLLTETLLALWLMGPIRPVAKAL